MKGHQNIVQLIGIAWEKVNNVEAQPVLVLEYAHLGSLQSLLSSDQGQALGFQQKRELCLDIAQGMAHVHVMGMVWGDCKPNNVLLFPNEHRVGGLGAKLSDFGLCESQPDSGTRFCGISRPWAAPEADPNGVQAAGGFECLARAEIYSFGMVLWALVMDGRHIDRNLYREELQDSEMLGTPFITAG